MSAESVIRDISDTALWAAVYRARETERPDALFRDPFARRLAGERGERISASLPLRLVALLPESKGRQGRRPWSAVCRMGRAAAEGSSEPL